MSTIMPEYNYTKIGENKDLLKQLSSIETLSNDKNNIITLIEDYTSKTRLDNTNTFPATNKNFNMVNGLISHDKYDILNAKKEDYISEIEIIKGRYINESTNRVLRNAVSHLRFKDVRDENGDIIEDKVLIYDANENGILTYSKIFSIEELFDYVSNLSEFLKGNIVKKDEIELLDSIGDSSDIPLTKSMYELLNQKEKDSIHRI